MPYIDSNQARLYYECHGEGPAVVFAHGRGGNATSWWQQVPVFAKKYRVIVFDHRTFGRSRGGAEHFNQRQLAADLLAILDAEGIEKAALVTQSMGGWTGLGTALHHPERVSCLVLTSTPGGVTIPEVIENFRARATTEAGNPLSIRALAPDYPERNPAMATLYAQISAFNTEVPETIMTALRDPDQTIRPEQLEGYAIPTLFIIAEKDQIFPPALLHAVAERVPGAEKEDFPGAGHSPYFEDPERYNGIVRSFLARHLDG